MLNLVQGYSNGALSEIQTHCTGELVCETSLLTPGYEVNHFLSERKKATSMMDGQKYKRKQKDSYIL